MKYVYGSMGTIGFLAGIGSALFGGSIRDILLMLIFGAVCAAATEIAELSEKFEANK